LKTESDVTHPNSDDAKSAANSVAKRLHRKSWLEPFGVSDLGTSKKSDFPPVLGGVLPGPSQQHRRRVDWHGAAPCERSHSLRAVALSLDQGASSAMTKVASLLILLVTVLVGLLSAAPAMAQRDRVFVASYGNDSNPCTFGSPCKTFQFAYSVVAVGGEVTAIDSAGFGPLMIQHSVTITSPDGVEASIAVTSSTPGINIEAGPNDVVSLRGLTIDGAGVGATGILFGSGKSLTVEKCVVRNLVFDGLYFVSNAATTQTLAVSNSYFTGISHSAIGIVPQSSGAIMASIDRTGFYDNFEGVLMYADDYTGAATLTVTNSVAANNSAYGFLVQSASGQSLNLSLTDSLIEGNGIAGVEAFGAGVTIWLAQSTLTGNGVSTWASVGVINTYLNNHIDTSNGAPVGSSLVTVAKQ
jgi:hypothetical protein